MMSVDLISGPLDLLSDTVYREQASTRLENFLRARKFPVEKAQIYGLREIARQQPEKVEQFAKHQRGRAKKKGGDSSLESEIGFWKLVADLCENPTTEWSVRTEGKEHLPAKLRDENIPKNHPGMSPEDRSRRNKLKKERKEWLDNWIGVHAPAFFERFCTHALYRLGNAGNAPERTEHDD